MNKYLYVCLCRETINVYRKPDVPSLQYILIMLVWYFGYGIYAGEKLSKECLLSRISQSTG